MSETSKRYPVSSIQTSHLNNLVFYSAIFLSALCYYYFFTEKLPWFWIDTDIYWLERAEKTPLLDIFRKFFDFSSENFTDVRPIMELFMKLNGFFGASEEPHYYRIGKMILFSITVCLMFYLTVRHGGNKFITALSLSVFTTLPPVMITNTPVTHTAPLELLFKISSFIVFFKLVSGDEKGLSMRSILFSIFLLLLIVLADKSLATAKIIPLIFLTYLILTKKKTPLLYVVMFIAIFAVFHSGVLYSAGSRALLKSFYGELLITFLKLMWPLIIFALVAAFLIKNKEILVNRYILFYTVWLVYEILFYVFYPSQEMRYLFPSLAAACVLLSVVISNIFKKITRDNFKKIANLGFTFVILYLLVLNTWWSYNFRGSFVGSYIIADKKMKAINQKLKNSLCIFSHFNVIYYSRNTSNHFVNLAMDNAFNMRYYEIYSNSQEGIRILNPERYENIIVLDESLVGNNKMIPIEIFDSLIKGSLYDSFQRVVNLEIHSVGLYDTSLYGSAPYPLLSGIYKVK